MRHPDPAIRYIRSLFARESNATRLAREALERAFPKLAPISIGAEEGRLLQLLVRMNDIRRVVEIGSLVGYSALWMAEALPEDGEIHAINIDPAHDAVLRQNISHYQGKARIMPHLGDAREILKTLAAAGPYDMVFIDADKIGYPEYLDWAEQHVRKGGLIVGDNTLLFGHVWKEEAPHGAGVPSPSAWQAMREFNRRLADTAKYHAVLLPTEEGMTVAIRQ